ncbi:dTDP-3-amino-3,4,6-trideoxy-alpha-D-glucose transaminase [bacterium HR33]|nr:dTDP-3-amino-3,4,6-trideoxy-alpha-D-glucose transaminase [bacterium HR33]
MANVKSFLNLECGLTVPLLDLKAQFSAIRDEVMPALLAVIERQQFILGPEVEELEKAIAKLSATRYAVACASGTDALLLTLKALDLEPEEEVITSPFTFFATAGAIWNAGGKPVFADIEPETFNIDPAAVEAAIGPRTRAVVPVHLFGQMARMEDLLRIASGRGLVLIEDAAQAIGARRKIDGRWRMAGELGWAGAFSFFPSKNLGAWGDGGMIVTQDGALAERLRRLRTHGGLKHYHHEEVGTNSRLDTLQAAVLLAKLPHLGAWSAARREVAARYSEELSGVGDLVLPKVDQANEHIFHQYTIRTRRRDALLEHLRARGIGCAVYYPTPLHLQPCFAGLGYKAGQFPEAERASREVLSLPVYPELDHAAQGKVIDAIKEFFG